MVHPPPSLMGQNKTQPHIRFRIALQYSNANCDVFLDWIVCSVRVLLWVLHGIERKKNFFLLLSLPTPAVGCWFRCGLAARFTFFRIRINRTCNKWRVTCCQASSSLSLVCGGGDGDRANRQWEWSLRLPAAWSPPCINVDERPSESLVLGGAAPSRTPGPHTQAPLCTFLIFWMANQQRFMGFLYFCRGAWLCACRVRVFVCRFLFCHGGAGVTQQQFIPCIWFDLVRSAIFSTAGGTR